MRARLTWRVPRWSRAGIVEALPAVRARYGERVAEIVERYRDAVVELADEPRAQDHKRTLRAIADDPAAADVTRLDSFTHDVLVAEAWKLRRTWVLEALQPDELAECARRALLRVPSRSGRPKTEALAVLLVRDLLVLLPAKTRPVERNALLQTALMECGLGSGSRSLKGLLAKAAAHARRGAREARPPSPWQSMVQALEAPAAKRPKKRGRRAG